jgi:transposase
VDTRSLSREEEFTMPKSRPPYPPEFKRRLVEMVRAGRNPEELAEKFEPTAQSIRNWVAQADRDDGHRQDGLTLGGHFKTGHQWTGQNRPPAWRPRLGEVYLAAAS